MLNHRFLYILIAFLLVLQGEAQTEITPNLFEKGNLTKLSKALSKGNTKAQSAEVMYLYIVEHFNPVQILEGGKPYDYSLDKVLLKRSGSAFELATLYKELCNRSGILCEVIPGYYYHPTSSRIETKRFYHETYYWNAVHYDNSWHLVDIYEPMSLWLQREPKWQELMEKFGFDATIKSEFQLDKKSERVAKFDQSPKAFVKTHMPVDPSWQLLDHPLEVPEFRLKSWKKDSVLNIQDSLKFPWENGIKEYRFSPIKDCVWGKAGQRFFDSSVNGLVQGRYLHVTERMENYSYVPIKKLSDPRQRIRGYDSLIPHISQITIFSAHSKKFNSAAFKYEKTVISKRRKSVSGANKKMIRNASRSRSKDRDLSKKLKDETSSFESYISRFDHKKKKLEQWKLKEKNKGKPPSKGAIRKMLNEFNFNVERMKFLSLNNDTIARDYNDYDQVKYYSTQKSLRDTVILNSIVALSADSMVELYNHSLDSLYFSTRTEMMFLDSVQHELRDSILKVILRKEKKLVSAYKRNLSESIKLIKRNGKLYYELSLGYPVDSIGALLLDMRKADVQHLDTLLSFYDDLLKRNEHLNNWLIEDATSLKEYARTLQLEMRRSELVYRNDMDFVTRKYKLYNSENEMYRTAARKYRAQIKKKQSELKDEIRRRQKQFRRK